MNAVGWFALGAVTFGTVLGTALFMLLAGAVRYRCYRVCREQVLTEYGINIAAPVVRRRSPDEQLVWRDYPQRVARPVFDTPPRT